jgi:hypothetical protein
MEDDLERTRATGEATMAAPRRYGFDLQYFPLVVVLVTSPEAVDEDGIRELFARFADLYRARKRYAILMDTTAAREVPNAKQRKVLTDLYKECIPNVRRWCVGSATVVDSALVRGVITAVTWVVPPPCPLVNVATRKEAIDWCCTRLEAEGIAVPPEAKDALAGLR